MFNFISAAKAQTPALQFTKPMPESVAKSLHDMVASEMMRENAASRRPRGIVPDAVDFLAHMIVAGIDPETIIISLMTAFIAKSRKAALLLGLVAAILLAVVIVVLDYSAHHYDGVIMSRTVSFDLPSHAAASFVDVWIEVFIFYELVALIRRRKVTTTSA